VKFLMSSYRLSVVPDALQGRVSGIYRLILFNILTIGPPVIGLSLEHLGVLLVNALRNEQIWPSNVKHCQES
jgi:hypothetical protein